MANRIIFRTALGIFRDRQDFTKRHVGAQLAATHKAADSATEKKEEGAEQKEGAQKAAADMTTDSAIAKKEEDTTSGDTTKATQTPDFGAEGVHCSPSTPPKPVAPKRTIVEPLADSVNKRPNKEAGTQRFVSQ